MAAPGELESPSATQALPALNLRASVESVCWVGQEEQEAQLSPLALSQTEQRQFLDGRPGVPKLPLARLTLGEQGALAAAAVAVEPEETTSPQPAWPVPRLPLSKLNPQAAALLAQPGPLPADPLDDLDEMLGSATTAPAPTSARDLIAAGFSRLLTPLRSARSGRRPEDWTRQLSQRGKGTPRSWAEDSGELPGKGAAGLGRRLPTGASRCQQLCCAPPPEPLWALPLPPCRRLPAHPSGELAAAERRRA